LVKQCFLFKHYSFFNTKPIIKRSLYLFNRHRDLSFMHFGVKMIFTGLVTASSDKAGCTGYNGEIGSLSFYLFKVKT